MPRGRSPNREKAFELWKKSDGKRLLRDIAEELGVSEAMVRKWKNQDGWESAALPNEPETLPNRMVTLPNKTAGHGNVTKRKPATKGAPKGNRNAAGHGAPPGNQNHYVHGLYTNPTFDMIPAEELERLRQIDYTDEEALIIDEVILLTSRERQLLESIQKYQDAKNGLSLDGVTRRTVESEGVKGNRSKQVETTTRTRDVFDVIQKLQAELTKVQKEKRQYLSELRILRAQKAQMPKEDNTHERVLQDFSDEELRALIRGEKEDG